jgi:endo-1,4-beta-mannosidase
MGPMDASNPVAAAFARTVLFSLWANDCHGFLWWCAYDQNKLTFPPYEWYAVERDLGLIRTDRTPKPVFQELKNFSAFTDQLPFQRLPVRKTNTLCILTEGQDQWAVAYSTYILAKQAGLEPEFQHANQSLRDAPVYLMPSVSGTSGIRLQQWLAILQKVEQGATLYVSCNEGFLSPFADAFGIEIVSRQTRSENATLNMLADRTFQCEVPASNRFNLNLTTAKALAVEKDNNPVFTVNSYGKGRIYFLAVPLETSLTSTPGAFGERSAPYWKIYKTLAEGSALKPTVMKDNSFVGLTEHDLSPTEKIVVAINYSTMRQDVGLQIDGNWRTDKALYGKLPENNRSMIDANDATVFTIRRK